MKIRIFSCTGRAFPGQGHAEETIPKIRTSPSPTALRLQYFLGGTLKLDPGLGRTVVRLDEWASVLLASGSSATFLGDGRTKSGENFITAIAEALTQDECGLERDLLRKSLHETLVYSVGPTFRIRRTDVEDRLLRFLRVRGPSGMVRRFLSFHVFNVVWFQTADSFRSLARNQKTFIEDMDSLEQMCRRVVTSVCKSQRFNGGLPLSTAKKLVDKIERRLLGA